MNEETETFLDGNAAAGGLRDLFTYDITMATCQCNSCGKMGPVAETHVYAMEPGLVVRCDACKNVLMRLVTGSGQAWLDMRGMAFLQSPMPSTQL